MLIHSVYFWLKPEHQTDEDRARFLEGLSTLARLEMAQACYIGTPARMAPRPVVDPTYDYALTLVFKSLAEHDVYQVSPIHKAFVETCVPMTHRIVIYDAD